jgi:hypothetical protein
VLYRVEDSRVQSYFLGGKYPDVEEAALVALLLEQYPLLERVQLETLAERAGVPRRKARIVLALLKRHGMVREHRGGGWERLQTKLTSVDLSADLTDYEARREQDRAKLRMMVAYCQSARCRTRFLLEYFGEPHERACGACDTCRAGVPMPDEEVDGPFAMHATVRHEAWGRGMVMSRESDRITVLFDEVGYKTLSLEAVEREDLLDAG